MYLYEIEGLARSGNHNEIVANNPGGCSELRVLQEFDTSFCNLTLKLLLYLRGITKKLHLILGSLELLNGPINPVLVILHKAVILKAMPDSIL